MSDLAEAKSGGLFERDGELWEVIGFYSEACVLLQKVGTPVAAINRAAVIASSHWAESWKTVEPAEAVLKLQAHIWSQANA
jgi:hypothetical protein